MLLSALAFVAQGLLPLDLEDLDGAGSSRHAAAWMLWWIAFGAGGALLALGLRRQPAWTSFAATTLLAAAMVPMCALLLSQLLPAGLAQRIAFAIWFAWAIGAGLRSPVAQLQRQDRRRQHQGDDVGDDHRPGHQHETVGQPEHDPTVNVTYIPSEMPRVSLLRIVLIACGTKDSVVRVAAT